LTNSKPESGRSKCSSKKRGYLSIMMQQRARDRWRYIFSDKRAVSLASQLLSLSSCAQPV